MYYIISQITKYIITLLALIYSFECFFVFRYKSEIERKGIYFRQNVYMVLIHFLSYFTLYMENKDILYLVAFLLQAAVFLLTIFIYGKMYPKANRLIINNMCMLLMTGLVILSRLSFERAMRQFVIMTVALVITGFFPYIIRRFTFFEKLEILFATIGIVALLLVLIFSKTMNGSKLNLTIGGFSFQPSEYVKIIFVFAIACLLRNKPDFRRIAASGVVAAIHVLLLVASKDLGSALIYFVVYFAMLYVATKNIYYYLLGFGCGAIGAIIGYFAFSHVRVRVLAFLDPFGHIEDAGYQVAQSLFAIGTGGWFGMGLGQGAPKTIPVVAADFIFAAIVEELGVIFGICLILICLSCFVMFMNISVRFDDSFYKLIALGLSVAYGFQIFLTIGGVTKFIPLTGVTLPLVSYGGNSVIVTLCMFAIIQGLYITRGRAHKVTRNEIVNPVDGNTEFWDKAFRSAVDEGLKAAVDNPEEYELGEIDDI